MKFTTRQISDFSQQIQENIFLYINTDTEETKLIADLEDYMVEPELWQEEYDEVQKNWKNYVVIKGMSSRESFRIMEDFKDQVNNSQLQRKLTNALKRKGPFRNFRYVLEEDENMLQKWYKYKDKRDKEYFKACVLEKIENATFESETPTNTIDFKGKTFKLVENSENGTVNNETIFKYDQNDNIVTADYSGGTIKYGKIIGVINDDRLDLLYQCITTEDELKAGKAQASISFNEQGKMKLKLDWQWLNDKAQKGISEYIEI